MEAAGHEASEDLIDQAVEKLEDGFIPDTDDVLEAAGHEVSEDLVAEKLEDGLTANTDDVLESSEDLVDEAVKELENGLIAAVLKAPGYEAFEDSGDKVVEKLEDGLVAEGCGGMIFVFLTASCR